MNPAVLRQQMGHSSTVMTPRHTGEIPLEQLRAAFFSRELENMENDGFDGRGSRTRAFLRN
jgi:hypothetical protein